jgi:hypothetical protein
MQHLPTVVSKSRKMLDYANLTGILELNEELQNYLGCTQQQ